MRWLAIAAHQPMVHTAFGYFFLTGKKKAPRVTPKCLIHLQYLVGDAGFEPATPAV
jgi:hypothetical protein